MTPFLNGLGIVAATGRGTVALRSALLAGWQPPVTISLPDGRDLPVYPLPQSALDDKSLGRKVRRADRFSKMAIFAASDALTDAQLAANLDRRRIGLIVASALGSHATTFQFLDEILTYGDAGVSPTVFSHSVQNAAAAYVSSTLDIQGPTLTLTQVHFAFHQALVLARQWLATRRCDHVLVGGVDELGSVMHFICRSLLRSPGDGKIRPFAFSKTPSAIPGEGSAFFLLSATPQSHTYAKVEQTTIAAWAPPAGQPCLHILEADGTLAEESGYARTASVGAQIAAYAPLFGSMSGGSPLQAAAAALMLKEQVGFSSPIVDAEPHLPVLRSSSSQSLQSILLTRLHCNGSAAQIQLTTPD